jgi:hypothetical protein
VLAGGRAAGAFAVDDPEAMATTLLLATNALLPSSLSTRELGEREEVAARVARIADLILNGLCSRSMDSKRRQRPTAPRRRTVPGR